MKRRYCRYILAWAEVIPPALKFNQVGSNEWAKFYIKRFEKNSLPFKIRSEAEKYITLLTKQDCRCAFIWDKAKEDIIEIKKFL